MQQYFLLFGELPIVFLMKARQIDRANKKILDKVPLKIPNSRFFLGSFTKKRRGGHHHIVGH